MVASKGSGTPHFAGDASDAASEVHAGLSAQVTQVRSMTDSQQLSGMEDCRVKASAAAPQVAARSRVFGAWIKLVIHAAEQGVGQWVRGGLRRQPHTTAAALPKAKALTTHPPACRCRC